MKAIKLAPFYSECKKNLNKGICSIKKCPLMEIIRDYKKWERKKYKMKKNSYLTNIISRTFQKKNG